MQAKIAGEKTTEGDRLPLCPVRPGARRLPSHQPAARIREEARYRPKPLQDSLPARRLRLRQKEADDRESRLPAIPRRIRKPRADLEVCGCDLQFGSDDLPIQSFAGCLRLRFGVEPALESGEAGLLRGFGA